MVQTPDNLQKMAEAYDARHCVLLPGLISSDVASNMTFEIQKIIAQVGARLLAAPRVGEKPAYEIYGYKWWPMATFHMSLTSYVESIVGKTLLPSYAFFRSYQAGDICRIHADRAACEHSMSLTLSYADDTPWALSVENDPIAPDTYFNAGQALDYGGNAYTDFPMNPGDAVLYKGIQNRHGRLEPNPNRWSAHMFLHWVEQDGPYATEAYDGNKLPRHGNFVFPG